MCCDVSLYAYSPSKVAPIIFIVAFFLSTVHHIWINFRYKSWRVTGSLPWGGIVFIAGFAMREVSTFHPKDLNVFIASTVLILVAPPVYALLNYIVLGRTLYYVPQLSPIHPGRVITTFLGLDVIVGILTANGGARVANADATPEDIKAGRALLRASILLQVISFFLFVLLEYVFHRRCRKAGILDPKPTVEATRNANKVRRVLILMYISSVIISSRHIFRAVDVWQGYTGYLETHEWPLYVFDGAFMFANALMLNIWHPMKYLPNDNKIYLSKDGTTERFGPGWEDKRPFLITLVDPFDIAGIFKKRDKERFWDHEDEHPIVGQDAAAVNKESAAASAV
ncbi:MAG: hypothetical protein LQ338_004141 [Usnochroma carphineum]|nr:MAG: hypothetical protein LQ338_004141 [Usnochroma carphineum]